MNCALEELQGWMGLGFWKCEKCILTRNELEGLFNIASEKNNIVLYGCMSAWNVVTLAGWWGSIPDGQAE